jgi:polyhydroxybutyrate depolymerase
MKRRLPDLGTIERKCSILAQLPRKKGLQSRAISTAWRGLTSGKAPKQKKPAASLQNDFANEPGLKLLAGDSQMTHIHHSRFLHTLLLFSGLGLCLSTSAAAESKEQAAPRSSAGRGGSAGVFPDERIQADGIEREYRLVVPKSVDPDKPAPLLFAFHGFRVDSKDLMHRYSQLDKLAEEQGFIVCFPNGENQQWKLIPRRAKGDIALFDALYSRITSQYNVDLNRVYLAGMSNGGYFTHVLASERSDKIAAICSHSAGMGVVARLEPQIKHKYAVFIAHGADDSIVPVTEGRKTRDTYTKWGFPVKYVEVPDLNHVWGTKADINHQMWDFFAKHPLGEKD